jgi:XRE family transcriptional regulator, regulator of sulfur utilization
MADVDRRDFVAVFSAMMALAAMGVEAAPQTAEGRLTTAELSKSRVMRFADLPVVKQENGGAQRREIHETVLPAGQTPHPPHHHPNSEWLFIQTGTLDYNDNGTIVPVGPGDIVFSASNLTHGLKNTGATDASYIVFSVSKQSAA